MSAADATAARDQVCNLTNRQAEILGLIDHYTWSIGDGCPAAFISKRLGLHHETVREHFSVLYRKGWLLHDGCPAVLIRRVPR